MSACRINLDKKVMTCAGIGNVTTRVFCSPEPISPVNFSGTLGLVLRTVRIFEHPWGGGIIVMYTDGISSRWNLDDIPEMKEESSIKIASVILERFGRHNDDATVIVGK